MSLFKRLWNYFFGKKTIEQPRYTNPFDVKSDAGIIPLSKRKIKSASLRKQQLSGKILHIGKHYYRIKNRIGTHGTDKLKYEITPL